MSPATTAAIPAANRIIHVPRRFVSHEWGGTETVLAELATRQIQRGWRPEIHTSLALSKVKAEICREIPVHRYRYSYPFFGLNPGDIAQMDKKGGNLLSLSLFGSLALASNVRIYHAHTLKRLGGEVMTAARLRKKPFVVTLHGGVFDVPAAENAQMAEARAGRVEWGRVFGMLFRSRHILDEADSVVCVGYGEYEKARAALHHERIYHLGNGVDVGRFASGDGINFRRAHSIPEDAIVLACYSRFDPQKDQLCMVEAFDLLARESPRLHVVLAGPCTVPEYLRALDARIVASPYASRIHRLGAIDSSGSALPDAYHGCDLFVLPSRNDPYPLAVIEALWAGLPLILSSSVGCHPEALEPGQNGYLCESGSKRSLADALLRASRVDEATLRQMGETSRTLANQRFGSQGIAEEFVGFLEAS